MGDAQVRLLAVPQVGLRDQDVAHGQHAQAADLLGRVEDDRREPRGHLRVQPDLDTLCHRNRQILGGEHHEEHCPLIPSDKKRLTCNIAGAEQSKLAAHRLDLVLALHEQIQQLLRVHRRLAVVGHQPNERLRGGHEHDVSKW